MRIFISAANSNGLDIKYRKMATEVAEVCAKRNHKLVFNGALTGLAEKCYMAFKYEDARIKAILDIKETDNLNQLEVDAYDVTINTMQRIEHSYKASHLVIILPGGIMALAELFTILDEIKRRKSATKLLLYNEDHYYDTLIDFMKKAYHEGFISDEELQGFDIITRLVDLEDYLKKMEEEEYND